MNSPVTPAPDWKASRDKLIGLGERSLSKSYYPELAERLADLERFRDLLDHSNDAIFLLDADTAVVLDAVGSAPALLGRDKARIVGMSFLDFLRPKTAARITTMLAEQGADIPLTAELTSPGGASVPVELTLRVAHGPSRRKAVVVARDVSERRKAERAVRRAEERYRSIVENAVEGFFTTTPSGRFLSANSALATLLGYASAEALMTEVTDIRTQIYADAADRDRLIQQLKIRGGARNFQARFRHTSGRTIWVSLNIRVVRDAHGLPLLLEGSCEDITVRKNAEAALREAHAQLEKRVEDRTRELNEANERLMREVQERRRAEEAAEAANRTKSDFLSMVSHEIRTPLTSILGFSKIIQKKLDRVFAGLDPADDRLGRLAAQVAGNMGIIVAEGERLTTLINDVLDLAKLESGRMDFTMARIEPAELIKRVLASTSVLLEDKDVRLIHHLEDGLPVIQADRDRIYQVLVNLISNAVKFTDAGTVTVSAQCRDGFLHVSVADTGIGIAKKDFGKIFEKFNQVRTGITDRPKGTGLGLPICRHIVESHGGRIWFDSAPGKGSVFTFTLPVSR